MALAIVAAVGVSGPASAAVTRADAGEQDGAITVVSDRIPDFTEQGIVPGEPVRWRVTGTPTGTADVSVRVDATGDLSAAERGLWLEIQRCSGAWTITGGTASCAGTVDVVSPDRPLSSVAQASFDLGRVRAGTPVHLLAAVRAATAPPNAPVVTATVGLTFGAVGAAADDDGGTLVPTPQDTSGAGAPGSGAATPGSPGGSAADAGPASVAGPAGRPGGALAWTGTVVPLVAGLALGALLTVIGLLARAAGVRRAAPVGGRRRHRSR